MSISKLQLFKARIRAFKTTLQAASANEKKNFASTGTVENLNKIISDVADAHPELVEALPQKLTFHGPGRRVGISNHNFTDIEIVADQIIALLDLLEE